MLIALEWVVEFLIGLGIGLPIAAAVHEGGHIVCALATGIPVRQLTLGIGPLLLRRRFGEITFELKLLPLRGVTFTYPVAVVQRWRHAFFFLGGVLANLLVLVLAAAVDISGFLHGDVGPFRFAIMYVQAVYIVANLVPNRFRLPSSERVIGSDGLQLIGLFRGTRNEPTPTGILHAKMVLTYTNGSAAPDFTTASSRIMYHVCRLDRWTDPQAALDFMEALLRELARGGLPAPEETLVIESLITHAPIFGSTLLRPRLDELSLRAENLAPVSTVSASRGSALVELGRFRESKAILEALAAHGRFSPFETFMTEVHLARAEAGLDNQEAAHRWAAAARRSAVTLGNDPATPPMLARMETELTAAASACQQEIKA